MNAAASVGEAVPAVVLRLAPWTGLGVVRSLEPLGIPLVAVETTPKHPCAYTRLCRKILVDESRGQDVWTALEAFGHALGDVRPVLFLTTDHDVVEASDRREALEPLFRFRLPPADRMQTLMDKARFAEFAKANDLPIPATHVARGAEELGRLTAELPFPSIVKPTYRSPSWNALGVPKAFRIESPAELRELSLSLEGRQEEFVIQEWIPGGDDHVFFHLGYWDGNGVPVAGFTGRKIRQWPPLSGSTSAAEPAAAEEVGEIARRLMRLAGQRGLGSVEVKRDARDGAFRITEPTVGRPNLQSEIATANGVNLVYEAYCELTGLAPRRLGVSTPARWFFIESDVSAFLANRRAGRTSLREFAESYRSRRRYAEFSWRDPLPLLALVEQRSRRLVRKQFAARVRSPRP